jgi:hypothetical protein
MNHMNIVERDFFGVYYAYHNQRIFLNPFKTTAHQIVDSKASQWVLHLGVKYYVPEPQYIKDEHTRELFCLQLQQDLKEKRITIDPSTNQAKELVALMLQSKLGDFSERDHTPGYSKSHFNFLFDNENDISASMEEAVVARHKELQGKLPADCDNEFLTISKGLDRYGKQLFHVEEFMEDRLVEVGANYSGVSVYYQRKLATDYPWSRVNKLLFHGRKFKVRYHPHDDPEEIRSHKFVAMDTKWSKQIWHECVEQHTFFRLAVPGSPPLPRVVPQLHRDSKYRFSGRTLRQMTRTPPRSPSPPNVSSPDPPQEVSKDVWIPPRSPSPVDGTNAGYYHQSVSVDVGMQPKQTGSSHGVAMISFPYDYSPSQYLKYRIVIRNGRKTYHKELSDPPLPAPIPSYRLKWTFVRNSDLNESCKLQGGVAIIEPIQQVNGDKRPINVYSPSPNQDGQLSDEPGSLQDRGHFTSTESLEDIIDKEMRRKGRAVVQEAQV